MMRAYSIGAAAFIAALLGVLVWLAYFSERPVNLSWMNPFADPNGQATDCNASVLQGGLSTIGGPFELVNAQGQTVTDTDVLTMPSVIYFGYTFCPDVCPLDNANNALAVDILEQRGYMVQPVFISIDPRRDTPDQVGAFASAFHDRMIGLTGSEEQVRAASQAYRTFYSAQPGDDEFYLVDHSTFSYFVIPGRGTVEVLRHDMSGERRADIMQCYLDQN